MEWLRISHPESELLTDHASVLTPGHNKGDVPTVPSVSLRDNLSGMLDFKIVHSL